MSENEVSQDKKVCEFKAEVKKVLQILTNSLYTNREIFIRELVSNASDALDKLRFRQNCGETPDVADLPLEIKIALDKDNKTITISDTGIGMTEQELADNLGIIARSGSENFLAQLAAQAQDDQEKKTSDASQIIGRFGVGFYSVFMVASKVEVISRPAFDATDTYMWESDGLGTYTVSRCEDSDVQRGTKIVIHLKDGDEEYAEKYRMEGAIRKHSGFVPFPVFVDGEKVNTMSALWRESKSQVKPEQYKEFYKAYTYDQDDPMDWLHINVDLPVQFSALLFIPSKRQEMISYDDDRWGIDLYSRRVMIQRNNKDLIPTYLGFLKGVVDTEDLPLNISRETLQENVVLRKINQTILKQMLNHLEKMAKDKPEEYATFWKEHGRIFKLSYQDYANRDKITSLLRFNSSRLEKESDLTSIDEYIEKALEGQKTVWYVTAPNREAAKLNPYMDLFRRKGIEVLFFFEPFDEFLAGGMGQYKEFTFKSIETAKEEDLASFADKEEQKCDVKPLSEDDALKFKDLLAKMKEILGERVKDVIISQRLADSAAVLASEDGITSAMDKLMRVMSKDDSTPVKTLEVNEQHPLLRSLLSIFKANADDPMLKDMVEQLFASAMLMDGYYIREPQELAARIAKMLEQAAAWYTEIKKL